jgi:hypothetical protein
MISDGERGAGQTYGEIIFTDNDAVVHVPQSMGCFQLRCLNGFVDFLAFLSKETVDIVF